jgi:hypothetical protein
MKTAATLIAAALMCCAIPFGFALLHCRAKPKQTKLTPTYHIRTITWERGEYVEL